MIEHEHFKKYVYTSQYYSHISGGVTGLGITLKVMSGDHIDIFGKSYYFQANSSSNYSVPTNSIIDGLFSAPSSITSSKGTALLWKVLILLQVR